MKKNSVKTYTLMKKAIKILSVILVVFLVFVFSRCNPETPAHTHDWANGSF